MIVGLAKKSLAGIVKSLAQVTPRKASVPALGHVLFESGNEGGLQATATDLEQALTLRIVPERLDGAAGRFLFPLAELKTLGKSMPRGGTVTLQPVGEGNVVCTVEANGQPVVRTITTMPVVEFPVVSVQTEMANCDVRAFLHAYRQAAFAAQAGAACGLCRSRESGAGRHGRASPHALSLACVPVPR
jgi:DNA polymerase III sliding clamp (beta) subunit (PCNA family)